MTDRGESHTIDMGAVTRRVRTFARDKRPRILVVDDDEIELELIGDRLAACGLEVVRATDGVHYLTKKAPDVELLARIHAAFSTVNLRHQLQQARQTLVRKSG